MRSRTLPIASILLVLSATLVAAHPSFTPKTEQNSCVNGDPVHDYNAVGSIEAGDRTLAYASAGLSKGRDGNLLLQCTTRGDAHPGDFDGEVEWATSGGFMPAPGSPFAATCNDGYPIFYHHSSAYTVADAAGKAWFSIGADDQTPTTAPATDVFDPDGTQCVLDGSITPDTDCDDYLSPNWIGYGTANTGTGGPSNTLVDALPVVGPVQAVVGVVEDVLGIVFGTGVVCPFSANTNFGPGGDGIYTIFVSGAVINDNTPTSVAPIVVPATVGHICDGNYGDRACFNAAGNTDHVIP